MFSLNFKKNRFAYQSTKKLLDIDFERAERESQEITYHFTKRPVFRDFLQIQKTKLGLEDISLIVGHGGHENGTWKVYNLNRGYSIENIIKRLDGRMLAILVFCCNRKKQDLLSRESIIIYPSYKISMDGLEKKGGRIGYLKMFVPGYGQVS